ncbi:M48 family metalloprotease [Sphingomonas sp. GlSt437]|uniref:M48 family metalloprotease n=1 Tax=Sphingomonas sp. GlSt437 TaxID=3389970 RepID=UPI003A86BFA8
MKKLFAAFALLLLVNAQAAQAQSILRDAETEALFADMTRPIILAAGLSPKDVRIVLIQDSSINAFTAGGQTVYINSGLIEAADTANQVQGVLAHELGHVADGHVVLADAGARPALGIALLSLVLGVAAIAAGAGEGGAGILAAGQTAAQGKYLAFSRVQEATADATAARFLDTAGISGKGFLEFFKKLQNEEYRYGYNNIDPYEQTHPLSGDRIAHLTDTLKASASWSKPLDPALEERFKRVKAKLEGYIEEPTRTLRDYPLTNNSVYAHYARAYAYHKGGYPEKADAETMALIKAQPHDPYFLEVRGQILLEAGKPVEALTPLREATQLTNYQPLIATTFGHALIATENKANYDEAEKVLRQAVARDDDNPFAWFQLGTVYELKGDNARALLATAERASLTGDNRTAASSARGAMQGLKPDTPDWIRAQDIALASQNELDDQKGKRRR